MKLGYENKFVIKCPRCSKPGRLRLKDQRYNMVEVSHYDSEKYQKGRGGGNKPHYIGTIKNPEKLINQIFEKYDVKFSEDDKKEFRRIIKEFVKSIKQSKETDITQNEITVMTSIFNELRKIRKIEEIKNKIEDRKLEWTPFDCSRCKNKIKVWAKFRGVQTKQQIRVWYSTEIS